MCAAHVWDDATAAAAAAAAATAAATAAAAATTGRLVKSAGSLALLCLEVMD